MSDTVVTIIVGVSKNKVITVPDTFHPETRAIYHTAEMISTVSAIDRNRQEKSSNPITSDVLVTIIAGIFKNNRVIVPYTLRRRTRAVYHPVEVMGFSISFVVR